MLYLEEELLVLLDRHDEVKRGSVHDESIALLAALQLLSVPLHLTRHRHATHSNNKTAVTKTYANKKSLQANNPKDEQKKKKYIPDVVQKKKLPTKKISKKNIFGCRLKGH